MPIHACTLPGGGQGWQWGRSGKCYPSRAQAERQATAIYASGWREKIDLGVLLGGVKLIEQPKTQIAALLKQAIDEEAHRAATSDLNITRKPTEAQISAGNYKLGHIRISGLDISIENPAGSKRRPEWPVMPDHYGYIRGTTGADDDHVDCFVRTGTPEDWNGTVYVVDQIDPDGAFDEHKSFLGYGSEKEALDAYIASHDDMPIVGPVTAMSLDEFKAWLASEATTEPLATTNLARLLKFRSDQLRDENGRWIEEGGAIAGTELTRSFSTVEYQTGLGDLIPYKTVGEVSQFFDSKTLPMDINEPATVNHAAAIMSKEFDYQVQQGHTGLDWYDKNVEQSFEIMQQKIPELADPMNRLMFSLVAGIQSQQTDVPQNVIYTAECMKAYFESMKADPNGVGQFPLTQESGKKWGLSAKAGSLQCLNGLIRDMGPEGALSYAYSMHTVDELNGVRQYYGTKGPTVAGKMNDEVNGLVMFGPKIGPFAMNMTGIDDSALTADLWVARTLRRMTGTLTDSSGAPKPDAPTEIERRFGQKVYERVAQEKGITVKQAQAVMWVYEQKLWGKMMGKTVEAKNFVDGARKYVDAHP
jgi:hypothetical protein